MAARSSAIRYGRVAVSIHWLSALFVLALIGSGFRASGLDEAVAKAAVLQVHVPLALLTLLLTVARIGWWRFADKKPVSVPMPEWQKKASHAVHLLLYVVVIGMAASGVGMMILSGAGSIKFGGDPSTLPDFWDYAPRYPHGIGARVLVALFVLHAGAALYHQFVNKDGLLSRMWFSVTKGILRPAQLRMNSRTIT